MDSFTTMTPDSTLKRPRSPSNDILPPSKSAKTQSTHLQINYLARQYNENIPLVSSNDPIPDILRLIGDYDGVLHRHESIAGNLGACPLGPILIRRFERLFDGPPRILKSHGKDANITWLDVVEFARTKPEQFNLEKMRNGVRVCQFYTKQSRVEISEEDYVLIASGMPQKLIPPQPIMEDEEKELGALEILEKNLGQIVQLADQVSARARQLNHRLKGRKSAIISRRESEVESRKPLGRSQSSPPPIPDESNGFNAKLNGTLDTSQSPPMGFTAVNMRQSAPVEGGSELSTDLSTSAAQMMFPNASTENVTIINGTSIKGASPATRAELMKKFFSSADRDARSDEEVRRSSVGAPRPTSMQGTSTRPRNRPDSMDASGLYSLSGSAAVAIPNTPASLLPQSKPSNIERDDGGPYKAEMVNRMESLHRGERIIPPCDRCRRLHMDCLKNLTACMGCTKKHAKCSWKDVREEELRDGRGAEDHSSSDGLDAENGDDPLDQTQSSDRTPVRSAINEDTVHSGGLTPPVQAAVEGKLKMAAPSSTLSHKLQEAVTGRTHASNYATISHLRESIEDENEDEGDRLQALAAQVYRTASQNEGRR